MSDRVPESRYFVVDERGQLWPISTVANGQPIGVVVNADAAPAEVAVSSPNDTVLAFLNALNPSEVERVAMARLGMGDGDTGPTRHIIDVLKELAAP